MKNKKIKLIKYTSKFKRQYKKFKKKHYNVDNILYAIDAIVNYDDIKLRRMKDHMLKGDWSGFRELHIESNLLMIYRVDSDYIILTLVTMGTHTDLFSI